MASHPSRQAAIAWTFCKNSLPTQLNKFFSLLIFLTNDVCSRSSKPVNGFHDSDIAMQRLMIRTQQRSVVPGVARRMHWRTYAVLSRPVVAAAGAVKPKTDRSLALALRARFGLNACSSASVSVSASDVLQQQKQQQLCRQYSTCSIARTSAPTDSPASTPAPAASPAPTAAAVSASASASVSGGGGASVPVNWVDRKLPVWFRPYARLSRWDKPIGTWLLLWPCAWSTALAIDPTLSVLSLSGGSAAHAIGLIGMFGAGALVMRGAGCTINDLWDRDFDRRVARTADRPLASGAVTPFKAIVWCGVQCSVGLGILLTFNLSTYGVSHSRLSLSLSRSFV